MVDRNIPSHNGVPSRFGKVAADEPPARIRKQRCETCYAYAEPQKFPPRPSMCHKGVPNLMVTQQGIGGAWPPTEPKDFCRQWEPTPSDAFEESSPL